MDETKKYLYSVRIKLIFLIYLLLLIAFLPFWSMSDVSNIIEHASDSIEHLRATHSFLQEVFILFYAPMLSALITSLIFTMSFFFKGTVLLRLFDFSFLTFVLLCTLIAFFLADFPTLAFFILYFYWIRIDLKKGIDVAMHEV